MSKVLISGIAAIGKNRELGVDNKLPWHIPEDLKFFMNTTKGHVVIMGRQTYDSINNKALPNRTTIIITRDKSYVSDNAIVAHSVEEAISRAKELETQEMFIVGGAKIFESSYSLIDRMYVTLIDKEFKADKYLPEYKEIFTKVVSSRPSEYKGLKYTFMTLEKE